MIRRGISGKMWNGEETRREERVAEKKDRG